MTDTTHPTALPQATPARLRHRNTHQELRRNLSPLDKLALWVTGHVGSMGFFLIIFTWTLIWLSWNFLGPKKLQFDPPMAFVFWLFISNVLQILLMPLIMIGQNLESAQDEARAEYDLEVNVKAEDEVEVILRHLEDQNAVLKRMLEKVSADVAKAAGPTTPEGGAA
ncbi:MAG: DUF1003 domain-containing protein [Caulobacterales bacterium]